MAVVYRIRPFLWTQIRSLCVLAFTKIQALSIQQSALSQNTPGLEVSL